MFDPNQLKPFLAPLFEPVGAIWLLMALSLLCLAWRRQWRCAAWLAFPTLLIFLIGSTPLVETVVAEAERPYATNTLTSDFRPLTSGSSSPADVVVVLGGGYYPSDRDFFKFAMANAGSRVLTGVELVRTGRAKCLVLGGSVPIPARPGLVLSASVQDWVEAWRVAGSTVTNLGICADTHDEAVHFRKLKEDRGWQNVILVTSALHMPRAHAVFSKQGLKVTPVACDFQSFGVPKDPGLYTPFPRLDRFILLSLYLHEQIGTLAYRWRGWI